MRYTVSIATRSLTFASEGTYFSTTFQEQTDLGDCWHVEFTVSPAGRWTIPHWPNGLYHV